MTEQSTIPGQQERQALERVRRQFDAAGLRPVTPEEQPEPLPESLPPLTTGSLLLDLATGGYPRGRLVELFGTESSGKTTLALQAAAAVQQAGGVAALIDADHALDAAHAKALGVDAGRLLCAQPGCGEEALEICELLVRSNAIDLIIIDSVAALVPQAEVRAQVGQAGSDGQVRMLEQGLRRLSGLTARSRCCLLFLNQLRMLSGSGTGRVTTAGGEALKLYAALRIELRRAGVFAEQEENPGMKIRARVIKNKLQAPYAQAEMRLYFACGIDRCAETFDLACRSGVIALPHGQNRNRGDRPAAREEGRIEEPAVAYGTPAAGFSFGGIRLGENRSAALRLLRNDPDLCGHLEHHLFRRLCQPQA